MNYEPNTITWPIGSLVLHDCDAKNEEMLMKVTKYLKSGRVRAEYLNPEKRKNQLRRAQEGGDRGWFDLVDLHDPKRFGVQVLAESKT